MSNILSNSISMQKNTEISDNNFDSYTLVLKILSKIDDKDKLLIDKDGVRIDKPYTGQFLFRFYNEHSRFNTIKYLNAFFNNCEKIINFKFEKQFMKPDDNNLSDNNFLFYLYERDEIACFKLDLQKTIFGLNNLIKTYSEDTQMTKAINFLIVKINKIIKRITSSLEEIKIKYQTLRSDG
jgi:hypothetical protein